MTRLNRLGICALATAWFSCADLDHEQSALGAEGSESGEDAGGGERPEGRLVLTFHDSRGERRPAGAFSAIDAVYLGTQLADERAPIIEGDFAVVVVDGDGERVSTDSLDCRRFHIDRGGRITEVYMGLDIDGAQCRHGTISVGAAGAGLGLQLAPFEAAGDGTADAVEYTVLVARVGDIVGRRFPDSAIRGTFAVRPPEELACGDGDDDEAGCDDGSDLAW